MQPREEDLMIHMPGTDKKKSLFLNCVTSKRCYCSCCNPCAHSVQLSMVANGLYQGTYKVEINPFSSKTEETSQPIRVGN